MRSEIKAPGDQDKILKLHPLTERVYYLHESGEPYAEVLNEISRILGRIVGQTDVLGAFGSISSSEFARRLAIDWRLIPSDFSKSELLELLDAVCEVRGDQVTIEYWLRCLALGTGDDRVSDLIFWPDAYFGAEYDGRDLTSVEMLEVALSQQKKENG